MFAYTIALHVKPKTRAENPRATSMIYSCVLSDPVTPPVDSVVVIDCLSRAGVHAGKHYKNKEKAVKKIGRVLW